MKTSSVQPLSSQSIVNLRSSGLLPSFVLMTSLPRIHSETLCSLWGKLIRNSFFIWWTLNSSDEKKIHLMNLPAFTQLWDYQTLRKVSWEVGDYVATLSQKICKWPVQGMNILCGNSTARLVALSSQKRYSASSFHSHFRGTRIFLWRRLYFMCTNKENCISLKTH